MSASTQEETCTWSDCKHFTIFERQIYSIKADLLSIEVGLLSRNRSTIPLYKIEKIQEQRSLFQLLFNLSTIIIWVHDPEKTVIRMENIYCEDGSVYEYIALHVHRARQKMLGRYHFVEYMNSVNDDTN